MPGQQPPLNAIHDQYWPSHNVWHLQTNILNQEIQISLNLLLRHAQDKRRLPHDYCNIIL
uniref:Uncharacterized protein n=1 Tax=Arundo donax TaxID=35708 RepID=A0A0A9BY60_ARUDO